MYILQDHFARPVQKINEDRQIGYHCRISSGSWPGTISTFELHAVTFKYP